MLAAGWPAFMQHDPAAERYQDRLAGELGGFQVLLVDEKDDVAAVGASIPFVWDGTVAGLPAGWDAVVEQGVDDLDQGRRPSALSALSVTVARERLGQGLSGLVLQALKRTAAAAGLERLVVPVRPTAKSAYPLTPMERYIRWRRPDGAPFDFWLNNVAKHAKARQVTVTVDQLDDGRVRLRVRDDGVGFDASNTAQLLREGHVGLAGMRERAGLVEGTLEIGSIPGHGTTIEVRLPAELPGLETA